MLNLKSRKGEIATLLTLGLVILGGVLAIGSSIFLSQQKTSTSTKAATVGVECNTSNKYNCSPNTFCDSDGTPCGEISNITDMGCKRCVGPYCIRSQSSIIRSFPVFDDADPSLCGGEGSGGQSGGGNTSGTGSSSPSGADSRCAGKDGYPNACCVQDTHYCNGEYRYRWYGCTGAPCDKTIISTQGGPGHLINCPDGVNSSTNPDTGICDPDLPKSPPPPENQEDICKKSGGYCAPNIGDCEGRGTIAGDAKKYCESRGQKFCCKESGTPPPDGGGITTKQCEYKDLKECDKSGCTNCKKCADGSYKCEIIKEEVKLEPPAAPPAADVPVVPPPNVEIPVVPPAAEPILDVSGKCNDIPCGSPNDGLYWSKKCWNPLWSENTIIGCGGTWSYFRGQGCREGFQTGSESEAKSSCGIVPRSIHIIVKFVISNLNIEPTKPYLYLTISNDVIPSIVDKTYNLTEGGNFTSSDEFNIEASSQGLKFYVWYNPAGLDWRDSVGGNITIKDGEAEVTIKL